jgi:rod shape-determining protein MreC
MPRYTREIAIFLVIFGSGIIILFSAFSKGREAGPASRPFYAVLKPVMEAFGGVTGGGRDLWRHYLWLVDASKENERLKQELDRMRSRQTVLLGGEREHKRLKQLLDLKERHEFPSLAAMIIGEDAVGWYRTILISRGSEDGVKAGMPAATAEGLVGKVASTSPNTAKILLITDPNSSVDCRVGRTRDRGILSGLLDGGCILRYVDVKSTMKPGDDLETSGLDGMVPKGLAVGRIKSVTRSSRGMFLEAVVEPAADFRKMEEVLVVLGHEGGFDVRPGLEDMR